MDKYEFNTRVEQIKKLVTRGDYETAMKIADTIDWHRVRNVNLLSMISQVYERNGEYDEAKEVLLQAYERAPVGKRLVYKLTELALRVGSVREAEDYYREFCDIAPDDNRQNLLRYMILKVKGASLDQMITALERYTDAELDERWMYELAELYSKAGRNQECIELCDKIMLMFGVGTYVDKAMELKIKYAPLTDYQVDLVENRDKYEAKLKAVEEQYSRNPLDDMEDTFVTPDGMAADETRGDAFYRQDAEEEEYYGQDLYGKPYEDTPYEAPVYEDQADASYIAETGSYAPSRATLDDELAANLQQAREEENLAREMSRISDEGYKEVGVFSENTKILNDIHRSRPSAIVPEEPEIQEDVPEEEDSETSPAGPELPEETAAEELPEEEAFSDLPEEVRDNGAEEIPEKAKIEYMVIEARTPEKCLSTAIDILKNYHKQTGSSRQTIKVTAEKLNEKGILNLSDQIKGRDLVIEAAGDLNEKEIKALSDLMDEDTDGMIVILLDNPMQLRTMYQNEPEFMDRFFRIDAENPSEEDSEEDIEKTVLRQIQKEEEETAAENVQEDVYQEKEPVQEEPVSEEDMEEMTPDDFAEYACQYASDIDCSITGKSKLALYERVEIMEEDGIPLTKANAEGMIEEAADKAEKPSFIRLIKGVFSPKYDKEGLLILREEHFI